MKSAEKLSESSLIGHWKIKEFDFIDSPSGFTDDIKQAFIAKLITIGNVFFEENGLYSATMVEGQEKGHWHLENRTIVVIKDNGESGGGIVIKFYDKNLIKGELIGDENFKARVSLIRTTP